VSRIFPFGDAAVMTTYTIAGRVNVIKFPTVCNVAVIAGITARDMSGILPFCDDIVMAIKTVAQYRGVINSNDASPQSGRMAILAIPSDRYVSAGWGAGFYPT